MAIYCKVLLNNEKIRDNLRIIMILYSHFHNNLSFPFKIMCYDTFNMK